MNLVHVKSIDGGYHTYDADLLTPGGWVIDAGCRGFSFAQDLCLRGMRVLALDPAPDVKRCPGFIKCEHEIQFSHSALWYADYDSVKFHIDRHDFTSKIDPSGEITVPTLSLRGCAKLVGLPWWWQIDLLKMDIEGAEMEVLKSMAWPMARQISVEFHGNYNADDLRHLLQWYDVVQENLEDTLMVVK